MTTGLFPSKPFTCTACRAVFPFASVHIGMDGDMECPACGAIDVVELDTHTSVTKAPVSPSKAPTAAGGAWTPERVRELLAGNPRAVERAIVALYDRQTADEQAQGDTRYTNGVGFSGADARRLSFVAEFLRSGKHLRLETCAKYVARVSKYAGQLADIANAKAASGIQATA